MAERLVHPVLTTTACHGAFHADGNVSKYIYNPRCQTCTKTYGPPIDLTNPEEVETWLRI